MIKDMRPSDPGNQFLTGTV